MRLASSTLLTGLAMLSPVRAETVVKEEKLDLGQCRGFLQAYAGALTGRLASYTVNTPERLESKFMGRFRDETVAVHIICLGPERRMILRETTE